MELDKLVYRLIELFLSTEIFSKRRKIYAWIEEKPEWTPKHNLLLYNHSLFTNDGWSHCCKMNWQ